MEILYAFIGFALSSAVILLIVVLIEIERIADKIEALTKIMCHVKRIDETTEKTVEKLGETKEMLVQTKFEIESEIRRLENAESHCTYGTAHP